MKSQATQVLEPISDDSGRVKRIFLKPGANGKQSSIVLFFHNQRDERSFVHRMSKLIERVEAVEFEGDVQ